MAVAVAVAVVVVVVVVEGEHHKLDILEAVVVVVVGDNEGDEKEEAYEASVDSMRDKVVEDIQDAVPVVAVVAV
jgi:hypothetical protein